MQRIRAVFNRFYSKIRGKGFIEIIFSSTIVKAIMFLSAMFLPRFLSKSDYGSLSYSETVINYYLLLSGLGLGQATLKFCTLENSKEKKNELFNSTLILGTLFNIVTAIVFLIIFQFIQFDIPDSKALSISMIGIPFLGFIFQDFQFYLRSNFLNKKYAILSVVYSVLYVGAQILLAILFGVNGVVCARYLSYGLCIIVCLFFTKKQYVFKFKLSEIKEIKKILTFSVTLLIGNFFSIAVVNNETLFVGNFFKDSDIVANFKVSTYILQICVFFVDAIVVFVIPYFTKNINNKKWLRVNFKRLFISNMILMSFVVLVLFIASKWIVMLLWGEEYIASVRIIRILLIAAWCQTVLRAIPGNILAFIGGERYTLIINIITCVFHAIADYVVFKIFGESMIGFGLIIAYLFSGICLTIKVWRIMNNDYNISDSEIVGKKKT